MGETRLHRSFKSNFFVTPRYTVLQDMKKVYRSSLDQHLSMLFFYENVRTNNCLWTQHCNPTV